MIRRAKLQDIRAIGELFRSRIESWQRMNADGSVQTVDYAALNIYEQWGHGGAWMNDQTATLWLSHVLRGAGAPTVLTDDDGQLLAYSEVFIGDEPTPFGKHTHIGTLITQIGFADMRDALMQHLLREASSIGQISVNLSTYDEDGISFYNRYGLVSTERIARYNISTQIGQGFYKVTDHNDTNAAQIQGWHMLTGRTSNARQQWEMQWTALWNAVDEIAAEPVLRVRLSASGQEAFVCLKQDLYDSRLAEIYCWSNKPMSSALLVALRDWAHRGGYRTLSLWGDASVGKVMGNEAETTTQQRVILMRGV